MIKKRIAIAIIICLVLAAAAIFVFYRECAYGGGMAGWYRDCSCRGIERVDYDQTAADGPRRTMCLGLVTKRTCYRYPDGPVVSCDSLPKQ